MNPTQFKANHPALMLKAIFKDQMFPRECQSRIQKRTTGMQFCRQPKHKKKNLHKTEQKEEITIRRVPWCSG